MRRLPVYLVLDVSGSMSGEPIEAVRSGLQALTTHLRSDPYALETAHLSMLTFADQAKQVVPLTDLVSFQPAVLTSGGGTALGAALRVLAECMRKDIKKTTADAKGDWKPLVFLMTDGNPTDDWQKGLAELKKEKTGMVVACAAGPQANLSILRQITETVVALDTADAASIGAFFKWCSASISTSSHRVDLNKAAPTQSSDLPPPPPEIKIV